METLSRPMTPAFTSERCTSALASSRVRAGKSLASCVLPRRLGDGLVKSTRRPGLLPVACLAKESSKENPAFVQAATSLPSPLSSQLPGTQVLQQQQQQQQEQERGDRESLRALQAILGVQGLASLGALMAFLPGLDLQGPGSVIEAMGVLALIITVHEAGHFTAARSLGIHVSKFCIGFGPVILKYDGAPQEIAAPAAAPAKAKAGQPWLKWLGREGATPKAPPPAPRTAPGVEYSLRLIPLGGFVAFPDDDENDTTFAADDPDLLKNRPVLDRIIVVTAGVVANFIFAYSLLFTQVNTVGLVLQQFQPGVSVPKVIAGGVGEQAGLRDGDVIVEVQGVRLPASPDSVSELVSVIKERPNQLVRLVVQRNSEIENLVLKPSAAADGTGRINVQLQPNVEATPFYPRDFQDGVRLAWSETLRLGSLVTDGLKQLFMNFGEAAERLSGPVAIVAVGAEVARTSASGLFQFAAIVNLNLAVVNLLPLPALDGGFLLLLLIEGARGGKKLPEDLERAIMSSGLLLLLTAGVFLIVRDTVNLGIFAFL